MTIYYVDATTGNNSDTGQTEELAWETIAKVNGEDFSHGDSILFKRGETWREQLIVPSSGTDGSPITFGAYGSGEKPIISGADKVTGWNQYAATNIYSVNSDWTPYVVVEDDSLLSEVTWDTDIATTATSMSAGTWTIDTTNDLLYVWATDAADPDTHVMEVSKRNHAINGNDSEGKDYLVFEYLTIKHANLFHGIKTYGGSHWVIDGLTFNQNYQAGLAVYDSDDITIQNSIFYDNKMAIDGNSASNIIIRNNTIYDNNHWANDDGIRMGATNLLIEYNRICNNNTGDSADNIQIVGPSSNVTIRYNLIENGSNAGIILTDNAGSAKIYSNIITGGVDTHRHGIAIVSVNDTVEIYNNVIYSDVLNQGLYIANAHSNGLIIKNNIIYAGPKRALYVEQAVDESNVTLDNNLYYNTSGTLIQWNGSTYTLAQFVSYQSASDQDANSITANPLFVNAANENFHLQPSSPAINAGTNVGLTEDFEGNSIIGVPDIGAYESSYPTQSRSKITINQTDGSTIQEKIKKDYVEFTVSGNVLETHYQIVEAHETWKKPAINLRSSNKTLINTNGNITKFTKNKLRIILKFNTPYKIRIRTRTSSGWSSWTSSNFRTRSKDYKHRRGT